MSSKALICLWWFHSDTWILIKVEVQIRQLQSPNTLFPQSTICLNLLRNSRIFNFWKYRLFSTKHHPAKISRPFATPKPQKLHNVLYRWYYWKMYALHFILHFLTICFLSSLKGKKPYHSSNEFYLCACCMPKKMQAVLCLS